MMSLFENLSTRADAFTVVWNFLLESVGATSESLRRPLPPRGTAIAVEQREDEAEALEADIISISNSRVASMDAGS